MTLFVAPPYSPRKLYIRSMIACFRVSTNGTRLITISLTNAVMSPSAVRRRTLNGTLSPTPPARRRRPRTAGRDAPLQWRPTHRRPAAVSGATAVTPTTRTVVAPDSRSRNKRRTWCSAAHNPYHRNWTRRCYSRTPRVLTPEVTVNCTIWR